MDRLLELTSRAEATHFWFRGLRRFVTPVLREVCGGRTDLTLLDCGCGTGWNLQLLAAYGRTFGFDLTETGLALARRQGRPLARADMTAIPYRTSTFDVVSAFDVLPVVPDDRQAMREMARVLKPGGFLLATMAALDALRGDHSVLAAELRRYTRVRVVELLRDAQLEPVRVTYTFALLLPLTFAVRKAQRVLHGREAREREITVPPGPVNAALTALVSGEAALLRRFDMPIGSSLLVVARK